MPDPGLATAADYSEALLTARRAKSTIALLLALLLIGQVAVFLLLRYKVVNLPDTAASTEPSVRLLDLLHYLTGVIVLAGIGLSIVLAFLLCLIGHVMLVGRLIGVGRVTGAIIWTLVLIVFLFPWQTFLTTDFRVAGALWTWEDLTALDKLTGFHRFAFDTSMTAGHWPDTVLSWFRFVGAPVVALVLVLMIQLKSNRGLRMALGEDELLNEMLRQS